MTMIAIILMVIVKRCMCFPSNRPCWQRFSETRFVKKADKNERTRKGPRPLFFFAAPVRSLDRKVVVDFGSDLASFIDRAHDERLTTAAVAGREDFRA